ncbi:MAG: hypothetical protein ICV66_11320 [Chitinophagaceae bacterium]|nr:hypothetical protein [Chitinophagaceae bacterium]
MDAFLDAWLKGIYPLRIKAGLRLKVPGVQEKNKFIWILSYDRLGSFKAKDSMYYASEARNNLKPDPREYIADVEAIFRYQ